tara:strand:- start:1461 stop:3131 length:1671 start_codon:yes stop_codon:yes gene_type:complete
MGLVSPVRPVEYKGDGTTKRFSFPFPYDDKNDVVVELCTSGTNNWIKQSEGGSYRFINDNTIEFNFAPKHEDDSQNAIKISRQTYARRIFANRFQESRPECAVVDTDCRGEYDGTDGTLTDDRNDALRPFKVGDTLTYTSPCDEGANVYWYATPRTGLSGSATLIRTDFLRGRNDDDKTTSLELDSSHIDKRISVKVKCIGCGPPDGLCCEWTVNTDNDVLDSNGCGLSAVIGSSAKKMLHDIQPGYGVIRLTLTSPDIGRTFNIAFLDGTNYDYTVGGGDTPSSEHIISKPNDSRYVVITVPDASSKGWQYSLRCTEAVDTSKYTYARWVGGVIEYHPDYSSLRQGYHYPSSPNTVTTAWYEYNPGTKTDGYLTVNGPRWSNCGILGGVNNYLGDVHGDPSRQNYKVVPWRSSFTMLGQFCRGFSMHACTLIFGGITMNGKGKGWKSGIASGTAASFGGCVWHVGGFIWKTVGGYWEFSNDTSRDKVVEARWDGHRGDAYAYNMDFIPGQITKRDRHYIRDFQETNETLRIRGDTTLEELGVDINDYMPNLSDID